MPVDQFRGLQVVPLLLTHLGLGLPALPVLTLYAQCPVQPSHWKPIIAVCPLSMVWLISNSRLPMWLAELVRYIHVS